jgi:hypothetical protein
MADIKIGYSRGFKFNGRSPVLTVVESEIHSQQKAGFKIQEFAAAGRASTTTIYRWMNGRTRHPQFDKVAGVLDLLGMEVVLRRKD